MKNILRLWLILPACLSADTSNCQSPLSNQPQLPAGSIAMIKEYFHGPVTDQFQCTRDGQCSLKGWLYIPSHAHGEVELPTVIYNHGSAESVTGSVFHDKVEPCAVVKYFLENGYMVFAPYRRGYDAKDLVTGNYFFHNTGKYVGDYVKSFQTLDGQRQGEVFYLKDEVRDVQAALTFLTTFTLSNVASNDSVRMDQRRVYLLGRSFGGIVTMYAAATQMLPQPKAAVTISGAAESFTLDSNPDNPGLNPYYKDSLTGAVANRKIPIFFAQPANEASLLPTLYLAPIAITFSQGLLLAGPLMEAGIFPPVLPDPGECSMPGINTDKCAPNGLLNAETIHTRFTASYSQVQHWGPAILAFFELYRSILYPLV